MAMEDLFTALNMLNSNVHELAQNRAIQGANDQVQSIKSAELDDAQKRQALTGISQQLVGQLAGIGTPVDRIQEVARNFGPPQLQTANQMNAYGLLNGDKQLQEQASQQQDFENDPKYDLARLKYQNKNDPMKQMMFQEKQDQFNIKQFGDFNKGLDSTAQSGRNAFGQGALAIQKAGRVSQLLGDPNQFQNMDIPTMTLVAEGLSNVAKGGVATKEELDSLLPKTEGTLQARVAQFFGNKPAPAQLQQFAARYKELLDRETAENKLQTADTIMTRASGRADLYKRDPDQFKLSVATNLAKAGVNVTPDDIKVNPKGGVTAAPIEALNQKVTAGNNYLKKAYAVINAPNADPTDKIAATKLFQAYGLSPQTPLSQNAEIMKRKIKMGMFQ